MASSQKSSSLTHTDTQLALTYKETKKEMDDVRTRFKRLKCSQRRTHTDTHTLLLLLLCPLTVHAASSIADLLDRHFLVLPRSHSHRPDPETRIKHTNVQRHRFLECVCVYVSVLFFALFRQKTRRDGARVRRESFADGMWVKVSPPPFHPAVYSLRPSSSSCVSGLCAVLQLLQGTKKSTV